MNTELLDRELSYEVKKVELKKTLDPKTPGDPNPVVLKVGLVHGEDKIWPAELYCHRPEQIPEEGSKHTLVVSEGKFGLDAKRPRKGGGGGFKGRSPADSARIEKQSARRDAIEYAAIVASVDGSVPSLHQVKKWADEMGGWISG